MNFLKYLRIIGGEIPQSDKHPWGTDTAIMPIPLEFAQKLRANNFDNKLADQYKRFLGYKVFRLVPVFINLNDGQLPYILNDLAVKNNVKVLPYKLYYDKIQAHQIEVFTKYRSNMKMYKNLDEYKKQNMINTISNYYSGNVIPILKTKPLFWLNVLGTPEELEFSNRILEKQNNDCIFIDRSVASSFITNIFGTIGIGNGDITIEDFTPIHDNKKTLDLLENMTDNIIIIEINISMVYGAHAVNMIVDNFKKKIYFADSNGFDRCDINLVNIKLPNKFNDYTRYPIMANEYCPSKMFQGVTNDQFCQTWSLFNILITILNRDKIKNINDIDAVFNKVIDIAKPICYYKESMSDIVRLSLLVLEFMFYIYTIRKQDFNKFLKDNTSTDKEMMKKENKYVSKEFSKLCEENTKDMQTMTKEQIEKTLSLFMRSAKAKASIKMQNIRHNWEEMINKFTYDPNIDSFINKEITDIEFDNDGNTIYDYIEMIYSGDIDDTDV